MMKHFFQQNEGHQLWFVYHFTWNMLAFCHPIQHLEGLNTAIWEQQGGYPTRGGLDISSFSTAKDVLPQDLHGEVAGRPGMAVSLAQCPAGRFFFFGGGGRKFQWIFLGGGFKYFFLFSPLLGEMIQFG